VAEPEARQSFDEAVREVAGILDHYLGHLRVLAERVLSVHAAEAEEGGTLAEGRLLRPVRELVEGWLAEASAAIGYGFVAAPSVVDDRERCMLWFQRDGAKVSRLVLNFDPSDIDVYDYLEMEWFTRAQDASAPVVFGPYVDYSGSDQYVVTLAVPILTDTGVFLGVAGGDLLAAGLEGVVRPILKRIPVPSVLVDAERRVVLSNTARWIPGDRVRRHPLDDPSQFSWVTETLPGLGWAMAAGEPSID